MNWSSASALTPSSPPADWSGFFRAVQLGAVLWLSATPRQAVVVVLSTMLAHLVLPLAQQAQPASQLLSVRHKFEVRAPDLAEALARRRDQAPPSNQRPLVFFHLRKSGGSQVRDALRDASRSHNLSSFIPCYNRVPCESYTPPRQMIYNQTATGSPRYAILAGHCVESKPCMAGQRETSVGLPGARGSLGRALAQAAVGGPAVLHLQYAPPAAVRPWQAGHLQYSGVEKWMWASSKLRGARVAHTALTQMGKPSRREGKPTAGIAGQAPPRDTAAQAGPCIHTRCESRLI